MVVSGDEIIVPDGVYTDFHPLGIRFHGKSITLRSENGPTNCIIDCNATESNPRRGFIFLSGEDSILDGFTIINGIAPQQQFPPIGYFESVGGAIFCTDSSPTIRNCIISGNSTDGSTGGGIYSNHCNLTIINCIFNSNSAVYGGGIDSQHSNLTVTNCILRGNTPNEIGVFGGTSLITYSNVQGGWSGTGNIDIDPNFAEPGYWDDNGTPGNPDDDYWVNGNYHLKSQAGRYDTNSETWVYDDVTSPCIDAGNPNSPIGLEPFPNGGRINMGAYGGTAEASKSYFGEPVCETIVAGDINGDCKVNFKDFSIMARHWLERGP